MTTAGWNGRVEITPQWKLVIRNYTSTLISADTSWINSDYNTWFKSSSCNCQNILYHYIFQLNIMPCVLVLDYKHINQASKIQNKIIVYLRMISVKCTRRLGAEKNSFPWFTTHKESLLIYNFSQRIQENHFSQKIISDFSQRIKSRRSSILQYKKS